MLVPKARIMRTIIILCVLFAIGLAAPTCEEEPCPDEYQKLGELTGKTHTLCQYEKVGKGKVKNNQIKEIVERHNRLRTNAYPGILARAMCKVYWDSNMARIAQYYASTCPTGHDELRDVPGYNISTEQNLAWNESSWDDAIYSWFNTRKFFKHVDDTNVSRIVPSGDFKPYSRIVQDTMCRFGCGYAQCGNTKTYVCNYAGGDLEYSTPFKSGSKCQDCPSRCFEGNCECRGKVCYNGGTLNLSNCTCTCRSLYKGDMCQKIKCPSTDPSTCSSNTENSMFCKKWENTQKCPNLCKTCENFIKPPRAKLMTGYDT